ncbi:MAG: hypothetical protein DME19_13175 [Verrucomicrobia bacterium]|nr:MAG: hypothetical protein DME19_13175 [Verrucomicrobiota bacterium]
MNPFNIFAAILSTAFRKKLFTVRGGAGSAPASGAANGALAVGIPSPYRKFVLLVQGQARGAPNSSRAAALPVPFD